MDKSDIGSDLNKEILKKSKTDSNGMTFLRFMVGPKAPRTIATDIINSIKVEE